MKYFFRSRKKRPAGYKVLKKSTFFDSKWYSQQYPESKQYGWDPISHYLIKGWKQSCNPSQKFENDLYLKHNADVNYNPLLHYIEYGINENRLCGTTEKVDLDILFISPLDPLDGSYIWRVEFIKERLKQEGFKVDAESLRSPSKSFLNKLYSSKVVILSRINYKIETVNRILNNLLNSNKLLIYDIDDLNGSDFVEYSGRYKSNKFIDYEEEIQKTTYNNAYMLCDYVTVSTRFLKKIFEEKYKKQVFLQENKIPRKYISAIKENNKKQKFNIIYMSGTITHDYDASTIFLDLYNFLMKHKNVYLTIVGKSTVASCLEVFKKRINHIPFTSYENMLNLYSEHDLSIIPLDNNPFNNAKSNIKYIEAASQGVPVLARDCNSFVEVIEDGYNGFLYKFDDFYYKLDYIYSNREKLKTIAKNAMDDIQKKHIMETSCFTLINFLKTKLC